MRVNAAADTSAFLAKTGMTRTSIICVPGFAIRASTVYGGSQKG